MKYKEFNLTENHLKLIKNFYIEWSGPYEGSPSVDAKRPFGNSDVINDIMEILEIEPAIIKYGEKIYSEEQDDFAMQLFRDLETALQICCSQLSFQTGKYVKESYSKWNRIDDV